MEDFQNYLEELFVASVGGTTLKEQQEEKLKATRNESYMYSQNKPQFTKPNKFSYESY